jgi:hypothetical protein
MFPMSMHTAQPVVADRRNRTEAAAAHHRLARSLTGTADGGAVRPARPATTWSWMSLGGFRRPFRRIRRGAVA